MMMLTDTRKRARGRGRENEIISKSQSQYSAGTAASQYLMPRNVKGWKEKEEEEEDIKKS